MLDAATGFLEVNERALPGAGNMVMVEVGGADGVGVSEGDGVERTGVV